MQMQAPKGTLDILPALSPRWQYLEEHMRAACACCGYREVRTPVFEHTELFLRGVGDTTDVVQKEMYTFNDKGNRSITLKPEGTAGVVRMLLEHSLYAEPMPIKAYYLNNPCFRYEKPQSGRMREFHQFGLEAFGAANATLDAEQIALAWELLTKLGLSDLRVHINSIGCPGCRPAFHAKLKDFLSQRLGNLCATCNERFERNPMRILDCKSPVCQEQLHGAPSILDCLCDECNTHFLDLQEALGALDVPFTIDDGIVRGLDYYTKTVFEIIYDAPTGPLTLTGGGRYDGLVEMLGGPALAGVGFGMGMERVLAAMEAQGVLPPVEPLVDVFVCVQGTPVRVPALVLTTGLRRAGLRADTDYVGRSLKAQFKYADKCAARYVVVLGEQELESGNIKLRNMATREEHELPLADAPRRIADIVQADK